MRRSKDGNKNVESNEWMDGRMEAYDEDDC